MASLTTLVHYQSEIKA